ncbi:MAG: SUMF1/EgtB/PvdO family nonheme iron enzyme [Planctomycetes bacterium]|nr:SUMF1/EgtB/PvdO family nonheme iron enzyme [Planctomycetota bacterium]
MKTPDKIVARLAVERGWVTEEKVQSFLRELGDAVAPGSLARLLHERGLLDDTQQRTLTSEQSRQMRVLERYGDVRSADYAFGRHLLEEGLLEGSGLEEAMRRQEADREGGKVRRLATILVEQGTLDRATLLAALHEMEISVLVCATCATKAGVESVLRGPPMACGTCGGPMVDEATFAELRRERPPMPDVVRVCEQLTERQCGKFVLVEHIGSGGMGTVWKAWDRELGRWVAIKLLRSMLDPEKRDEDMRRFSREAMVVARLRHANIVSVYESAEFKGQPLIVMEYIDGQPLNYLRLTMRQAMETIREAARAVQYAHDQGIVHRDIKPNNVMRTEEGRVCVMDFGLARSVGAPSTLTQSGFVVGTPAYMAPEQARATPGRDEKLCDVYSLGATLYDLLTGRAPFEAAQPLDVMAEVITTEPVPPRVRNPKLPRDGETIILKAMDKDPARRYGSARAMAEDIDRCLKGEPILARPLPLYERALRVARRRAPLIVAFVAAVAVTGVALLAGYWRAVRKADEWVREAREKVERYREKREEWGEKNRQLRVDGLSGDEKRKLEKDRSELDIELAELLDEASKLCHNALGAVTNDVEARRALGELFWQRFLLGEEREEVDLSLPKTMVRQYGTEQHRADLVAQATLWLQTDPVGAEVTYRPYVEQPDGRLKEDEGNERSYGTTVNDKPLRIQMPANESGVLRLRLSGYASRRDAPEDVTVVPVFGRRGEVRSLPVRLYRKEEIPDGFVLVPGGPFIMGGDPMVQGAASKRVVDVPDFFIAIHEVTWREYWEFLDACPEQADERVPGKRIAENQKSPIFRKEIGRYSLTVPDTSCPVQWVNWLDAKAYCQWKSQRDGVQYRLPTSQEWEKAARGVDKRLYPWGDVFNRELVGGSRMAEGYPQSVGSIDGDESPYGVRDLAGNVMEWCEDALPAISGEKAFRMRGGQCGQDSPASFLCASRYRVAAFRTEPSFGFRLAWVP